MKREYDLNEISVSTDYNGFMIIKSCFLLIIIWIILFNNMVKKGFSSLYAVALIGISIYLIYSAISFKMAKVVFKGDKVYYKNGCFLIKEYDICSIAGIKITAAYGKTGGFSGEFRDKNGNIAYTLLYLKYVDDDIRNFKGKENFSTMFANEYHKNILFSSVYDERVIQYLKAVNPDIEIMD